MRPKLSEGAVETLLSEKGVPKWMEKLGSALVQLCKSPEGLEGMKPSILGTQPPPDNTPGRQNPKLVAVTIQDLWQLLKS